MTLTTPGNFVMNYDLLNDYRIQLLILVILRMGARALGRGSAPTRLALNASFFATLTALLLVHDLPPYEAQQQQGAGWSLAAAATAKSIWWIAGSMLLVSLIRLFLVFERTPREGRLLQDVLVGVIFVGTALSIISYVFSIPVGTLIATSGVFAIVLGLALQNTLADVFSGVALNLGRPYRVGDWIVLDEDIQGRVVETNWRATHLLNTLNDLVIVPNSALARAHLVNQSSPDETHGIIITLRVKPTYSPSVVVDVMRTVLWSSNHILKHPEPAVKITALDSAAMEVELICRVKDVSRTVAAKNELFDLAFRHSRAANLALAAPVGAVDCSGTTASETSPLGTPGRLINSIPLFASLTDEEKESVAAALKRSVYEKDSLVVSEGDIASGLQIVGSGVVVVERMVDGALIELTRLAPHDCFGERSVLLRAPETASKRTLTPVILYEVPSDVLRPLMEERPHMRSALGGISFQHTEHDHSVMADLVKNVPPPSYSFAERIRHLFAMNEVT